MSNDSSTKQFFTDLHTGTCWSSVIGATGPVKELLPMFASLFNVVLGITGLFFSEKVTEGGKFLYSTLFSYGVACFCFHLTLWEGFYRILYLCLNFMQAINIIYMACICPTENAGVVYNLCVQALIHFFLVYPFFVNVLVTSLTGSWISWVTVDGVWLVVLVLLLVIWFNKEDLGKLHHPNRDAVINLVWNIIICVVVAYFFLILDDVVCVNEDHGSVVIVFFGHSLWHVFIGLGFYYMTTLTVFLMAEKLHLYPKVIVWPKDKPFAIFIAVKYKQLDSIQRY